MAEQISMDLAVETPQLALPRPWPEAMTPALRRVLGKAIAEGCVRRAGIYAERPQEETAELGNFDFQTAIDRCVALGWLAPGDAYNTYIATKAGVDALAGAA